MMNNYDWLSKISLLDFLRDYGKLFNINTMLAKDVVASRLETGISFTEFSYQILQSIDYKMLYEKCGVQLQIGGATSGAISQTALNSSEKLMKATKPSV